MSSFKQAIVCDKCKKSFNCGNFSKHICVTSEIIDKIRQQYKDGVAVNDLLATFGTAVKIALRGQRRSRHESSKLNHKLHPEYYKKSKATRDKMSVDRKKYLEQHPEKVPYRLNHSSNQSWPEQVFENALNRNNIVGWTRRYMSGRYQYDFAFPLLKIDVEIDGETHLLENVKKIDNERDEWSRSQGWTVIRFKAKHVLRDVEQCIRLLQKCLENVDAVKNITNEIGQSFLMLRTKRERHRIEKNQRLQELQQEKQKQLLFRKQTLQSIEVGRGYISKLAKLWNVTHTQVRRVLKSDFLSSNIPA